MLDITFMGKWSHCVCYDIYCIFSTVPGFPALSGALEAYVTVRHLTVLYYGSKLIRSTP